MKQVVSYLSCPNFPKKIPRGKSYIDVQKFYNAIQQSDTGKSTSFIHTMLIFEGWKIREQKIFS